jgi:predicted ArsR family transcriptional regulator
LSPFASEVLRSEPQDVDELAAALGVIPAAVMAELEVLTEPGLVGVVTVGARRSWGLTMKGWSLVVGDFGVER